MKKSNGQIILLAITSMSCLSSCGFNHEEITSNKSDEVVSVDPTKTQLMIGNYDGDLGHEWLQIVADKYTALHPDVQIIINNEKDNYGDANLLTNIDSYNNDMYFLNAITYSNYVNQDKLLDITDTVNSKIDGEDKSILDKMNSTLKEYYKWTKNNKDQYYAVPFFDAVFGAMYDYDLFEDEGLFYNTDNELICNSENETKSVGPNGIPGDFDDGLPATYSQWTKLLDTMNKTSIIPYTWSGMYPYYRARFLTSIWADYEGKANFDINQSLSGSYLFDGDDTPTNINLKNGYLLQNQKGKEYALNMAKYIISNKYYSSDSFYSTNTHLEAQQTFLLSCVNTKGKRIGMILEGGWWENGAKPFFNEMAKTYGNKYAYGQRRFGFMPVPKSDDEKSNKETTLISSTGNSIVCIAKKTNQPELAKDFLKFVHSDESLRTFSRVTGSVRPYLYQLTKEDRKEMSFFATSMFDLYNDKNTNISYITLYGNDVFTTETSFLNNTNWFWGAKLNESSYSDPLYEFSQNANLTVAQYIQGMKDRYSESEWTKKLSKYFD